MYSLTDTGIHFVHQPDQNQPLVKMQCKCNRVILQQEIYTCLNCSTYSCQYCTVPEFSSYLCRSCKRMSESTVKNSKCTFCFACPYCQNVLTLSKDPKSKCWIYLCQFCYWNTKEINMKQQRAQILQDNLFKLSSLRQTETRIYNTACTFFRQTNSTIQTENQSLKYNNNKRPTIRSSLEQSNFKQKLHLKKMNENIESIIKHTSLEEDSEEYTGTENKYPHALALLPKKTRKCPECAKALTNIYRPVVSNEPNIELMHKQLKVIQCQRLAPVEGKVKIKFLKNCLMDQKAYKINQQEQVQVNKTFAVIATIQNKRKNADVKYNIRIQPYERKR